jgi:hypothetical protein
METHVQDLQFEAPLSLDLALALMKASGTGTKPLAGGTDLIVQMRSGRLLPQDIAAKSSRNEKGEQLNPGFLDYRMTVACDLPMIDTILIESAPNSRHPYGAKGVGEVPIVPPLATVASALSHIEGRRLKESPLVRTCDA